MRGLGAIVLKNSVDSRYLQYSDVLALYAAAIFQRTGLNYIIISCGLFVLAGLGLFQHNRANTDIQRSR